MIWSARAGEVRRVRRPGRSPRLRGCRWGLVCAGILTGCEGVEPVRVLANIETAIEGFGVDVVAPAEVEAGEPFEVSLTTYGGGCTRSGGARNTEIVVEGARATIRPYDLELQPQRGVANPSCSDILQAFRRTVTLVLPLEGDGSVTIVGLSTVTLDTLRVEFPIRIEEGGRSPALDARAVRLVP